MLSKCSLLWFHLLKSIKKSSSSACSVIHFLILPFLLCLFGIFFRPALRNAIFQYFVSNCISKLQLSSPCTCSLLIIRLARMLFLFISSGAVNWCRKSDYLMMIIKHRREFPWLCIRDGKMERVSLPAGDSLNHSNPSELLSTIKEPKIQTARAKSRSRIEYQTV